jgi:transposase
MTECGFLILRNLDTLRRMREADWGRVPGCPPGYRVYPYEIDEPAKRLKPWVRRKRGRRKLICSGCGRKLAESYDSYEREVRDLPCFEYRTTVVVELYRVRCPDCESEEGESAAVSEKGAVQQALPRGGGIDATSNATVWLGQQHGASHRRALAGWFEGRRKPASRQKEVDEIHLGKKQKILTVMSNLETGEPPWFGRLRKEQTLDEFFEECLRAFQRSAIRAACVDM